MNRAGQVALVLAALAVLLSVYYYMDRPRAAEEEGLSQRQKQLALDREVAHTRDLQNGLVIVASLALALVGVAWAGVSPTTAQAAGALAGVAALYLGWKWYKLADRDWAFLALILLLLVLATAIWFAEPTDGFSIGAIVLALVIEVVLYLGWVESPQGESGSYFYTASCLPATLVGVTLLIHRLQRQA